jgi:hypothetical protein
MFVIRPTCTNDNYGLCIFIATKATISTHDAFFHIVLEVPTHSRARETIKKITSDNVGFVNKKKKTNCLLLGIRMEQRIGGRLQTPLRTSAESFVDESHIVANFSLSRPKTFRYRSISV